jgi:UDP-N-acetylglucosamine 4,6-dehydratase
MSKKSILITGGTGTFGKAFVNFCLESNLYEKVVIFSRDEYKQHSLKGYLHSRIGPKETARRFRFFLGDVRDRERLSIAFKDVDYVIHAAALKHVPFCEYNPGEAIKTNVNGTKNVCDIAIQEEVEKVVVLSTDKAVEPINFYGSTKMLAEKYSIFSNSYSRTDASSQKKTKISCVRYGNVVGSRGSIVEIFTSMMSQKAFKITDDKMTRFWMDIKDCVEMVQWSMDNMVGGEIVIPKIKASRVIDIAKCVDNKKPIEIIGIRPGEKIHEQLLNRRESERSFEVGKYFIIIPESSEWMNLNDYYSTHFKSINRKRYFSNDEDIQMEVSEIKEIIKSHTR